MSHRRGEVQGFHACAEVRTRPRGLSPPRMEAHARTRRGKPWQDAASRWGSTMAWTSRTQRNRSAGATSLCLLEGLVPPTLLPPTASAADLPLGSATKDVGSATKDAGSATNDVGSA